MIKILENKKSNKKTDPYYELKFDYMIGDADGDTTEEIVISVNNPFLERFVTLINKLKPTKGHWGIVFDSYDFSNFLKEKQLTQEEYDFLYRIMFDDDSRKDTTFKISENEIEFADEFYEGISGETDYSFLVFQGVTLSYFDEYGVKHKTKIS